MKCRTLLVAVAVCGAAVTTAQAADVVLAPRAAPSYYPSYYPQSMDWSGFYLGAHIGGMVASAPWTDPFSGSSDDPQQAMVTGGGQFGVNFQEGWFLYGFEVDVSGFDLAAKATDAAGNVHTIKASWLSTITARAGYTFGQTVVYLKGGAAFGNENNAVSLIAPAGVTATTGSNTQVGWTIGTGAEYAIDRHWSVKVEYNYIDLSHPSGTLQATPAGFPAGLFPPGFPAVGNTSAQVDYTVHRFIAGMNFRF
jgi:outer membrane immunogenic protein